MSDEITKDRSPRSPLATLEDAIEFTRKFYAQARTAAVKPESAAKAMGYSGMTGTSMTTLATLGQYGLLERTNGNVAVSSLAVRILHHTSEAQKMAAIREAALLPKVFQVQLKGFEHCAVEIITNHLIQEGFAPDRAKKVAAVYLENQKFAKLDESGSMEDNPLESPQKQDSPPPLGGSTSHASEQQPQESKNPSTPPPSDMLAQYSIPLGANQATLVFTGQALSVEDFDALADFVDFAKKQFARKMRSASPQSEALESIEKNIDRSILE